MLAWLGRRRRPAVALLRETAEWARQRLRHDVFEAWLPRCLDTEHGGFLCDFDARWRSNGPHPKQLEFQARQTRVAALACRLYPEESRWRDACRHGFEYLRGPMWDEARGGWFYRLDRAGVPQLGETKHGHGIAYAIHACVDVARALEEPAALELARRAFDWFDARAWDREQGGFWGWLHPDGEPFGLHPESAPAKIDPIGTPVEGKDVNVNGDTLEALVELVRRSPWEHGKARLQRLRDLLEGVVRRAGRLSARVTREFEPLGDEVEPGQELQATYRLPLARAMLGEPLAQGAVERQLWAHALSCRGEHDALRDPRGRELWWEQFELLRGLAFILALDPGRLGELRNEIAAARHRLERWYFDAEVGGVNDWASDDGAGRGKGNLWKDGSHEAFTLLAWRLLERLDGRNLELDEYFGDREE